MINYMEVAEYEYGAVLRESNESMLSRLDYEITTIHACQEAFSVVTEASSDDSTFEKVKKFLSNLFKIFSDKVKELASNNTKWVQNREEAFGNMQYGNITVNAKPYWNMDYSEPARLVSDIIRETVSIMDDKNFMESKDTVANHIMKVMLKKDVYDKDILMNYLRFETENSDEVEPVELTGAKLRGIITKSAIPYTITYENKMLPALKKVFNEIEVEIGRIEKKTVAVKENYSVLESLEFDNIDIGRFISVTEADASDNNDEDKKKEEPKDNVKKSGNTDVSVKSNMSDARKKDLELNNANVSANMNKRQLAVYKEIISFCKTSISIEMTVAEERYTVYMKLLRELSETSEFTAEYSSNSMGKAKDKSLGKFDDTDEKEGKAKLEAKIKAREEGARRTKK